MLKFYFLIRSVTKTSSSHQYNMMIIKFIILPLTLKTGIILHQNWNKQISKSVSFVMGHK